MEYLLKSAAIVTLFYISYKLFLEKETYFSANRVFLVSGLLLAFIVPFIIIPIYVENEPIYLEVTSTIEAAPKQINNTTKIDYSQVLSLAYLAGVVVLLLKSITEFISLKQVLSNCKKRKDSRYTLLETSKKISPFSFFNIIVYNPNMFDKSELRHVISHEKAHAGQWHSLDVMLAQLVCILLWFNPLVWFYKKELQQNLEFIADQWAQGHSECSKTYQHVLLKTSVPNNQLAIANHFYNSLIKKRIVMLHKNPSHKRNQWKLLLVVPLLAGFMLTFNTKVIAQSKNKEKNTEIIDLKVTEFAISKDSDDNELEDIKSKLKTHGVKASFKKIKRNSNNEITAITINASGKKSNANYSIDNEGPISSILINYNETEDQLSIGNSKNIHFSSGKNVAFTSKDGDNVIVEIDDNESEDGAYVFTTSGGQSMSVKKNVKVIELKDDDDKIIELKEGDGNVFVVKKEVNANSDSDSDNDVEKEVKVIVLSDSDGKSLQWTDEDEVKVLSPGNNKVFISGTDSDPLIFINDKESTKEEMNKLDSKKIERMDVLKGDKAIEKYGDKAKDGVIKIYTSN